MNKPIDLTGVTLRTGRLILRPFQPSDLDDFYEYARVEGVGRMAGWTEHRDREESRRILDLFIEGRRTFALEHEGKVIGSLGVEAYNEEAFPELGGRWGRELGYVLAKDYWGRGLMPEAVRAASDWLFGAQGLDFLLAGHFEWNQRSRRVVEKCGFEYLKTVPFETRYDTVEPTRMYILHHPGRISGGPVE